MNRNSSTAGIFGSEFTQNTSTNGGGIVSVTNSQATISSSSISGNAASNKDGGVYSLFGRDIVYIPAGTSNELVINEIVTCAKFVQQIGAVVKVDYNAGGKLYQF